MSLAAPPAAGPDARRAQRPGQGGGSGGGGDSVSSAGVIDTGTLELRDSGALNDPAGTERFEHKAFLCLVEARPGDGQGR